MRLASLPTRPLPSCFWPRPSIPSIAWPCGTGCCRWPFPTRVPRPSWPPHSKPHSVSQKLLRCNYYRDGRSKLIFQLLHSCNHGDGPSSITCSSLFLKGSSGGESEEEAESRDGRDRGAKRAAESKRQEDPQRQRETETQRRRDRER